MGIQNIQFAFAKPGRGIMPASIWRAPGAEHEAVNGHNVIDLAHANGACMFSFFIHSMANVKSDAYTLHIYKRLGWI
ncbi:hypothetical protein Mthe_0321 [Methanothrix thermoacetophila PT]|uniref:Uncharacterized protein n=1 Tax=Methanothrix thermoacetophila (strain DSM 6194 / JCM 14653 / NBRC 101360 / PT) TaxID=349307 RepID=A0B5Z2_METTP|nr:hypothetical protein Mthe_0321 [Methanothrix thermoacetophila PT]